MAEHIQRHHRPEATHLACVRFFRALRAYETAWGTTPRQLHRAAKDLERTTTELTGDPDTFRRACGDPRHRGTPRGLDEALAEELRLFLKAPGYAKAG